jgi:hypothetical protein
MSRGPNKPDWLFHPLQTLSEATDTVGQRGASPGDVRIGGRQSQLSDDASGLITASDQRKPRIRTSLRDGGTEFGVEPSSTGGAGQPPPILPPAGTGGGNGGPWRSIRIERNIPAESTTWLLVALACFTLAVGAAFSALTLKDLASLSVGELWIICGSLAVVGGVCLIAHWDANRGRKIKQSNVEEWEEPSRPPI